MTRKKMTPTKKELLRAIRKETKPPTGFGQWVIIFEAKKLTQNLGLIRLEGYSDKRLEWSGSLSIPLPQAKTYGPDGREQTPSPNWDTLVVGASRYSVLTMEMRGKTLWEGAKGLMKRSISEGKIQDFLKLGGLG
jgi:hypothetical protein